jgi:FeS assembly SUF system regulator
MSIKLGKMTDYGLGIMVHIAAGEGVLMTAPQLSEHLGLALTTVSKLLKQLSGANLLKSHRGARGGYSLNKAPGKITIVDIITALEGPVSLMECVHPQTSTCCLKGTCAMRGIWNDINAAVEDALKKITLADLLDRCRAKGKLLGQDMLCCCVSGR